MKLVLMHTDGSCKGNGKATNTGGWAARLAFKNKDGEHVKTVTGMASDTTNNRMELMAVIGGLSALKEACEVHVFTDSQYVRGGMTGWCDKWQKNGWRNSKKEPVVNRDLWEQLIALAQKHTIKWVWVKGHALDAHNIHVDGMATAAAEQAKANAPAAPTVTDEWKDNGSDRGGRGISRYRAVFSTKEKADAAIESLMRNYHPAGYMTTVDFRKEYANGVVEVNVSHLQSCE